MVFQLPLCGLRILVAEDMALLACEVWEGLEAAGAVPVGPAPTVAKAMRLLSAGDRIDAALLNVGLGGQASFPVAAELARRGVPFLFVTGDVDTARETCPGVPVYGKPADMAAVILALSVTTTVFRRARPARTL